MCGRFAQRIPSAQLVDMFKTSPVIMNVPPNYNVAPTQTAMVVSVEPEKGRQIEIMKWGLVPPWSKTGKMDFHRGGAKLEAGFFFSHRQPLCNCPR